jgi:hypothetical protein
MLDFELENGKKPTRMAERAAGRNGYRDCHRPPVTTVSPHFLFKPSPCSAWTLEWHERHNA